jgi:hypothetical protein
MNIAKYETEIVIGVGIAAAVWLYSKGLFGATKAVINAAGDVIGGTVVGIGEQIGIPSTDQNKCQADIAAGDTWNASFDCPAGTFIKSVFTFGHPGTVVDTTLPTQTPNYSDISMPML